MPVNLSIKNVPDELARQLKERAARNHRSLQGEVLAILEQAAGKPRLKTVEELLAELDRTPARTPSESAEMIRADRDSR